MSQMNARVCRLELRVLYEISRIIGQALELNQTLEIILAILAENLTMKRAAITLKSEEEGTPSVRASYGLRPKEKKRWVDCLDEAAYRLISPTADPFVVPEISKEPLFLNHTDSRKIEKRRTSLIGVPIMLNDRFEGVLSVDRLFDDDVPFEEDVRFLTVLAAVVAQLSTLNYQVKTREQHLINATLFLKAELSEKIENFFALGTSPAMVEVQQLIRKVAPTTATALLLGESGTGKTLIARIIHELSGRASCSFIKMNCAALPDNLLEPELFGYEKDAFIGASESKPGMVEEADCGTLFLDEVGYIPNTLQVKLLRFLQDREFERLGSLETRKSDARIIAATNRDLSEAHADGSFREDLYYRLNVFPISVPPLRDRRGDIVPLINFFRAKLCRERGRDLRFTNSALEAIQSYSWPGNVRELENLIERLVIRFGEATIDPVALSPYLAHSDKRENKKGRRLLSLLRERERQEVINALERNNWGQSHAALDLGITLRQMGYRVKKFGLEDILKRKGSPS